MPRCYHCCSLLFCIYRYTCVNPMSQQLPTSTVEWSVIQVYVHSISSYTFGKCTFILISISFVFFMASCVVLLPVTVFGICCCCLHPTCFSTIFRFCLHPTCFITKKYVRQTIDNFGANLNCVLVPQNLNFQQSICF